MENQHISLMQISNAEGHSYSTLLIIFWVKVDNLACADDISENGLSQNSCNPGGIMSSKVNQHDKMVKVLTHAHSCDCRVYGIVKRSTCTALSCRIKFPTDSN